MNDRDIELIRDYLDDRISPENLEHLNNLLEADAEARAEFRAMGAIEEGLRDLSVSAEILFSNSEAPTGNQSPDSAKRWFRPETLGIAALFVICLGLGFLVWQNADPENDWGDAIAKIEFLSDDAEFSQDNQSGQTVGKYLGKGWIRLDSGHIRLLFRSGATLEASGPTTLGIATPIRVYLDYGKVTVDDPESAGDFVVATESMEVVDLGTRFEVEVDRQSRESNVAVLEGLVDLHLGSRGADRRIRPLEAGFAAHVDAFGKIVEITGGSNSDSVPNSGEAEIFAHWRLDEVGSAGEIFDSSGSGLSGMIKSEAKPESVSGIHGEALQFFGNEFVDLSANISLLSTLDDFTFSAWVRDPEFPIAMIFSVSGETERQRVQLYLAKGFVRYGWQNESHFDSISGGVNGWKPGQWYHVALTVEGGVGRLYRDGELIASGSVGSKIGTPVSSPSEVEEVSHAYLGWLKDGRQGEDEMAQSYSGVLDDVRIYSGALSHQVIRSIFKNSASTNQ